MIFTAIHNDSFVVFRTWNQYTAGKLITEQLTIISYNLAFCAGVRPPVAGQEIGPRPVSEIVRQQPMALALSAPEPPKVKIGMIGNQFSYSFLFPPSSLFSDMLHIQDIIHFDMYS